MEKAIFANGFKFDFLLLFLIFFLEQKNISYNPILFYYGC